MRDRVLPALLGTALGVFPSAQTPLKDLGPFVEQTRRDWGVPGVAVAVVKDDRVAFVQGHGIRTQGQPGAVNANTAFQLASVAKAFTAAALGTPVCSPSSTGC